MVTITAIPRFEDWQKQQTESERRWNLAISLADHRHQLLPRDLSCQPLVGGQVLARVKWRQANRCLAVELYHPDMPETRNRFPHRFSLLWSNNRGAVGWQGSDYQAIEPTTSDDLATVWPADLDSLVVVIHAVERFLESQFVGYNQPIIKSWALQNAESVIDALK